MGWKMGGMRLIRGLQRFLWRGLLLRSGGLSLCAFAMLFEWVHNWCTVRALMLHASLIGKGAAKKIPRGGCQSGDF